MGKSHFKPVQRGRFLGFDFDTIAETISVPLEKHQKTCALILDFKRGLRVHGIMNLNMKLLEIVRGKIMSWMLVCENWGFYTREMNYALQQHMARFAGPRAETELMPYEEITNVHELFDELDIWMNLDYVKLTRPWKTEDHITLDTRQVYTDASGGGLGSAIPIGNGFEMRKFAVPLWLSPLGIHVKEAYAIYIAIDSYGNQLYNKRVILLCDNRSVVDSWEGNGARDIPLARVLKQLRQKCTDHNINLVLKWVPTDAQAADAPSREISHVFARLKSKYGQRLHKYLGVNLDLFADPGNVLVDGMRFFSEYPFSNSVGVNGMSYLSQMDPNDIIYAYPPRVLSTPFLKVYI